MLRLHRPQLVLSLHPDVHREVIGEDVHLDRTTGRPSAAVHGLTAAKKIRVTTTLENARGREKAFKQSFPSGFFKSVYAVGGWEIAFVTFISHFAHKSGHHF